MPELRMRSLLTLLALPLLVACAEEEKVTDPDADADGFPASVDCDDDDASAFPGAFELCDGTDNDCDTRVDDEDEDLATESSVVAYLDVDGDGYGQDAGAIRACAVPDGYATAGGDCDDAEAAAFPGNVEACDGLDNDCDGVTDGGAEGTYYPDLDQDGFGAEAFAVQACEPPEGYVTVPGDCDEGDASANPEGSEVCDGADNDCDGATDDADDDLDLSTASTFYADTDRDGYGDASDALLACDSPVGFLTVAGDCAPDDANVNPTADEVCDGLDNDCDGATDDDDAGVSFSSLSAWHADADRDGHGDPASVTYACDAPAGHVSDDGDCDDADPLASPSTRETCDDTDNDCDGATDEGVTSTYYADVDADGYGTADYARAACALPSGFSTTAGDCDEGDATVNPSAVETCNALDDDCDGATDDADASVDASSKTTWYADVDADAYGNDARTLSACAAPSGYTAVGSDCDEADASVNPGADETCDGTDNDCDGAVDDADADVDLRTLTSWYPDADADGYGTYSGAVDQCSAPSGYVTTADDCDDTRGAVNPAAAEICDGRDNDCDAAIDDDDASLSLTGAPLWYEDADEDGYGDPTSAEPACSAPEGYVGDNTDCDDADPGAYPGAAESFYDGIDQACDDGNDYDADGDGYTSADYGGADEDDTDPTCWASCSLGRTRETAAASCEDILADDPSAPDGDYWIDPDDDGDTSDAFLVECDMVNGGWALCFELTNTSAEDLTGTTWFDDCVTYSTASWTGSEVRVQLVSSTGAALYDHSGTYYNTWSYDQITSTTDLYSQYNSYSHANMVALDNGDRLMIAGRNSSNSGCGGSFGNGYGITVYPSSPDYYSNPKMIVNTYQQYTGYTGIRQFSGWTAAHEISYNGGSSFNTCSSTPSQLGTFSFWVR